MACKETTNGSGYVARCARQSDDHASGANESRASDSGSTEANSGCAARAGEARVIPEAVRRLKDLLVEEYVGATVDMGEGMVDEGLSEPSVSDVRVHLVILSRPELQGEFLNPSFDSTGDMWRMEHVFTRAADSLENISIESLFKLDDEQMLEFSSGQRTYRIMAVASAGCGKTFIFTRVAPLKWAKNEMWMSFDLVVARKLRNKEVREATNICALLGMEEQGEFTSEERRSIDDFVRRQAHRVCLVLDGLDEIRLSDCSGFVRDIINGSKAKGLRLVVTSRPGVGLLSLCERKQFDRRVELVGFRPEDVEEYIRKVLRKPEEASALVAAVRDDQHLGSMIATPFLAMQTCKIFHCRNRVLPRCLSDIFDMMIIQVAERQSGESYKNWRAIPTDLKVLILGLGRFSFNMLNRKQLVFTDGDLQTYSITREAKSLGLLVLADNTSKDTDRLWMFSHLTLQESLAARYVAVKKATTLTHVVRLVELLGPQTSHLRTFWMLLAAQLDTEKADCLINSLLTRTASAKVETQYWEESDDECDEAFDVASQVFPLDMVEPLCAWLNDHESRRLAEELLSGQIGGRSGARLVERRCKNGRNASTEDFLKELLLIWVDCCPDATRGSLAAALRCMGKYSLAHSLTTGTAGEQVPRKSGLHKEIKDEHSANVDLAVHCYPEYNRHHGGVQHPMSSIAAAFQCMHVQLSGNGNPAVLRAYDVAIDVHHACVFKVDIQNMAIGNNVLLPISLQKCTNITYLYVYRSTGHWSRLISIIKSSCTHLRAIILWSCNLGNDSMTSGPDDSQLPCSEQSDAASADNHTDCTRVPLLLAEALSNVPRVQRISIMDCRGISGEHVDMICKALGSASCLEEYNLVRSGFPQHVGILTENLRTAWPMMTQLLIDDRGGQLQQEKISDDDVAAFVHAVNAHPSLQVLTLLTNTSGQSPTRACLRLLSRSSYKTTLVCKVSHQN